VDAPVGSFEELRDRLERVLGELVEDDFLIVGEPRPSQERPRGLLRRKPPRPPVRYVQFRDDGEWLYGECVGAALFGGDWQVTPEQHQRIRAMGWLAPGDPDDSGSQPPYPNYWRVLPRVDNAAMASLGSGALEVLGVEPSVVEWRRDR
jgi:hypothetical protein